MFHRHKWTRWARAARDMVRVNRYGQFDYSEEYQWRECTECGKYMEEVIG